MLICSLFILVVSFFITFVIVRAPARGGELALAFGVLLPLYVRNETKTKTKMDNSNRFTFLATLFLLLFVSSAIILRSFILRRRFRRRIEEAILAGVIPPPQTGRVSRRRVIGEKPKLWEARVFPASNDRWDGIIVRFLLLFLNLWSRNLPPLARLFPPSLTLFYHFCLLISRLFLACVCPIHY